MWWWGCQEGMAGSRCWRSSCARYREHSSMEVTAPCMGAHGRMGGIMWVRWLHDPIVIVWLPCSAAERLHSIEALHAI